MKPRYPIRVVADLTEAKRNTIFNRSVDQARACVADGDVEGIRKIDGQFALMGRQGHIIRMARSLAVPMRYFIAKFVDGPGLVVAHRIDTIRDWLIGQGLSEQFHPSYTRMVPAHYVTEIALVGCPDPNPSYTRFFAPKREALPADLGQIGEAYVNAVASETDKWLRSLPDDAPVGVCFSGGIDSGAVLLVAYHLMLKNGMNPARLKAFTLSIGGGGSDLTQAREFLKNLDLSFLHEPIEVSPKEVDFKDAVATVEDYKLLDVQAATVMLSLCRGIRNRYPDWTYLLDGDGGDENLKDYPIEANSELTIASVLNNRMLYQEGWGIEAIKHSLTYSGGLSRGCTRTFAPAAAMDFETFSPFMLPNVVTVAEGIPFIELTDWSHDRLYELKGAIVSRGVEALTGMHMPIFPKRRFQDGAGEVSALSEQLPQDESTCRQAFANLFDA